MKSFIWSNNIYLNALVVLFLFLKLSVKIYKLENTIVAYNNVI